MDQALCRALYTHGLITQWGRCCCCPRFIDEETEAQESEWQFIPSFVHLPNFYTSLLWARLWAKC